MKIFAVLLFLTVLAAVGAIQTASNTGRTECDRQLMKLELAAPAQHDAVLAEGVQMGCFHG